jgi:hypothetical protein
MENDIIFQIPDRICEKIGIDGYHALVKQYLVSQDGLLFIPWMDLFDDIERQDDDSFLFVEVEEAGMFIESSSLMECLSPRDQSILNKMINGIVDYHESKFDKFQERGEA